MVKVKFLGTVLPVAATAFVRAGDSTGGPAPVAHATPTPRFTDYPVAAADAFRGRPAPVDFSRDPQSRRFRKKLGAGTAKGPHFAGHIAAITWRCGSSCQVTAFADVRTGRIIRQSNTSNIGVAHKLRSRLFVADPPGYRSPDAPPDCITCGRTAYDVWDDDRLVPLGPGPHIHLTSW